MTGGKVIGKCRARHNSEWTVYLLLADFDPKGMRIYKVQLVRAEGEAIEKFRGFKAEAYDSFANWINF